MSAPARVRRSDIQALRAVAVVAVVAYHFWPGALPGGFVGVDIFFVISGFLITGHLLEHPPARAGDFGRFWARRILRLLPAAALVILVTLVLGLIFVSDAMWKRMATDAITSMFYVENWRLISESTNYLAAGQEVSAFQHFWSLSVEEQYYLFWPLLVGLLAALGGSRWVARRVGRSRLTAIVFAVVVVGSLVVSILMTASDPSAAYFSTFTRMWELGLGSLLAVVAPALLARLTGSVRVALLGLGAAGLAASLAVIDDALPFPGSVALLPTVSAALVILASDPAHRLNPRWLTHSRPVQLVGDISYALYLWHWPLITIAPYALGHQPRLAERVVVLLLSLVAAWASTRLVENPIRTLPALTRRTRRVFVLGIALSSAVVLAASVITVRVDHGIVEARRDVAVQLASGAKCVGASASAPKHRKACADTRLTMDPAFAKEDVSAGIVPHSCLNWPRFASPLTSCSIGDRTTPNAKIALLGNSQAGQWYPALEKAGTKRHWQVDTYLAGACILSYETTYSLAAGVGVTAAQCAQVERRLVQRIHDGGYDLVVVSDLADSTTFGPQAFTSVVGDLDRLGVPVLVLHTTPTPSGDIELPDCVAQHRDHPAACDGTPAGWIHPDGLTRAAQQLGSDRIRTVDLDDHLCWAGTCPAVVGGLIVYRDNTHMTASFARTMAPYLARVVTDALHGTKGNR
jgi:peptidoglycan/LPS O-acetylase OafA/YrhL